MPSNARKEIVREGEVGTYHCWSRCVQKAFLCGYDPDTQYDFTYRRDWIEDLLAFQAGVFAVDVGSYSVLSNHAHTILRTRPDIAATWSDEELALRWKMAWPEFVNDQWVREPTDAELNLLLASPARLAEIRRNLSSLSWFMARWKEPIAKLCNAEMDRKGHFWEARFGCRELLDEEAVLTCSIYVDLNQIRAGMAESLEESMNSSIRNRIRAAKCREASVSREVFKANDPTDRHAFSKADAETLFADCWLAPIGTDGPLLTEESPAASVQVTGAPSGKQGQSVKQAAHEPAECCDSEAHSAMEAELAVGIPTSSQSERRHDIAGRPNPDPVETDKQKRTWPVLTRRRASDAPFLTVRWSDYLRSLNPLLHSLTPVKIRGLRQMTRINWLSISWRHWVGGA